MAQSITTTTTTTTLSLDQWLKSAIPSEEFIYPDSPRVVSRNQIYRSLVESIQVEEWPELIPFLNQLGPELNSPFSNDIAKPVVLDVFHVLSVEASLEYFLNQTLIYCVNLALHSTHEPPITIIPHVPTLANSSDSTRAKTYTPDYTVFQGYIEANPQLLLADDASLIVGDVKLIGNEVVKDQVGDIRSLSRSTLGQLMWYCYCRKTRFGFCVTDHELILIEFVTKDGDSVAALSDIVARAEFELSSPPQELPIRNRPAPGKRAYASSTTGSTVSPSDRHQHKRSTIIDESASSDDEPLSSSPSLPPLPSLPGGTEPANDDNVDVDLGSSPSSANNIAGSSPRTPEAVAEHGFSSDSYHPSTPGHLTAQTLEDLASAGGNAMVRICSIPIEEREMWASALFKFVSLAHCTAARGNKDISSTPVDFRDYLSVRHTD
ncbi:hypothetical protein F5Y10DRAFT_90402 [Nemania abortiva]|nr:hypothetical protein F5Y10DRAFT_90402 [Nemania abortiva]